MKELNKLKEKCVQAMKDVDAFVDEHYEELCNEIREQWYIPKDWIVKIVSNCGIVCGCFKHSNIDEWYRFNDVHGNTYDYSIINKETYKNFHTPVPIICKEHGVFNQKPTLHAKGMGCPQCKKSLGENRAKRFLDNSHFLYIQQYKILNENLFCQQKKMFVDFYLPQQNVIIEFNGAQHYVSVDYFGGDKTFEKQQNRDLALRQYCDEHKIKLIEIPYTEINNIETILKKELKTK